MMISIQAPLALPSPFEKVGEQSEGQQGIYLIKSSLTPIGIYTNHIAVIPAGRASCVDTHA